VVPLGVLVSGRQHGGGEIRAAVSDVNVNVKSAPVNVLAPSEPEPVPLNVIVIGPAVASAVATNPSRAKRLNLKRNLLRVVAANVQPIRLCVAATFRETGQNPRG
jgi:hypothetical protein